MLAPEAADCRNEFLESLYVTACLDRRRGWPRRGDDHPVTNQFAPKLFGHERDDGMEQLEDVAQHHAERLLRRHLTLGIA